jgi:hypothetical protein
LSTLSGFRCGTRSITAWHECRVAPMIWPPTAVRRI